LDELRQAFVDRMLEVSLHAANNIVARVALAKATPDMPPGHDAKAKKAGADKRKAATAAAAAATAAGTKPGDGSKPPTKKLWCSPPCGFLLPVIQLHASPRAAEMAGVETYGVN
jgi:hypothetical protein